MNQLPPSLSHKIPVKQINLSFAVYGVTETDNNVTRESSKQFNETTSNIRAFVYKHMESGNSDSVGWQ